MHIPNLLKEGWRRINAMLRQQFPVPHASRTRGVPHALERPPPEKEEEEGRQLELERQLELGRQREDMEEEAEMWQRREQLHDPVEILSVPLSISSTHVLAPSVAALRLLGEGF